MADLDARLATLSDAKRQWLERQLRLRQRAQQRQAEDGHGAAPSEWNRGPAATRAPDAPRIVSFAQRRLWFVDQLDPGNPFYNCSGAVRLTGPLHVEALSGAFTGLAQRHEVLRTVFEPVDGLPQPLVRPPAAIAPDIHDLQALAPVDREAEAQRLLLVSARTRFDLRRGPLMHITLLRLAPVHHILCITLHHIVSDGWSMGVLVEEIAALYAALAAGRPPSLPDLPMQYSDYAAWQQRHLQGATLDRLLAFWREHLDGVPPQTDLPRLRPGPSAARSGGEQIAISMDEALTAALRALARREGVTLLTTLLAGFAVLLSCETGDDRVVIGVPMANRTRPEAARLIGFLVNTLPVSIDLRNDPTFAGLLPRVHDVMARAQAHQDLPFERLVEALHPQRRAGDVPLCRIVFNFSGAVAGAPSFADLTVEPIALPHDGAAYDLALIVENRTATLGGVCRYRTDRIDAAVVPSLLEDFTALLAAATADPTRRLRTLKDAIAARREAAGVAQRAQWKQEAGRRLREASRRAGTGHTITRG
jgi:hypothetical protein